MIDEAAHESDNEEIAALVNSVYRGESSRMGWTTEADLLSGQRVDAAGLRADLSLKPAAMVLTMRASAGEEILACVWLEQAGPDHFYLGMLAVRPTLQAGGLGRALLEEAEGLAKAAGARAMQLTVIAQRDALIAWYERRGYARTGVIKPFPMAPRGSASLGGSTCGSWSWRSLCAHETRDNSPQRLLRGALSRPRIFLVDETALNSSRKHLLEICSVGLVTPACLRERVAIRSFATGHGRCQHSPTFDRTVCLAQ